MPPEWECLPSSVSKRLDYLLSSLSLCLRFATLTQFPPTSDFRCFVFACQGSIASLAAIFAPSVDGDYTAPEQDSRAAADDRSRGKSYSSFNAATPRYGQCNRQAPHLFELLARNGKRLSFGRATPVFFLGKENGGRITCSACGAAIPLQRCRAAKHAILHTFHRAVNNNSASFIWKESISIWKSEKNSGARCRL